MVFAVLLVFCICINSAAEAMMTVEQAMNLLYEQFADAELYHPGELDTRVGNIYFFGFAYDDGDRYCYIWVNSMTSEIEFSEEIENYTGEGVSANTADMSDEELIDYLLVAVPEAYEWVVVMRGGLTALVTGDTTMLSTGICRDVRLGTDDENSFASEIMYSISPFGSVYEYDLLTDIWTAVYVRPAE